MQRVTLVCFAPLDVDGRLEHLRAAGFDAQVGLSAGPALMHALRMAPPDAVVIDLSRRPSSGRDVALAIRLAKATRRTPLVLLGGGGEALERTRAVLPDAAYGDWSNVAEVVRGAIANAPADPIVPTSVFAAYEGRPLAAKLGLKPGRRVGLIDAPEAFAERLVPLPAGAVLEQGVMPDNHILLWFCLSQAALEEGIAEMGARAGSGGLWVLWPKRGTPSAGDLSQVVVRRAGLANGLVDYKVAAIDEIWTGLRFTRRRET